MLALLQTALLSGCCQLCYAQGVTAETLFTQLMLGRLSPSCAHLQAAQCTGETRHPAAAIIGVHSAPASSWGLQQLSESSSHSSGCEPACTPTPLQVQQPLLAPPPWQFKTATC